MKNTFLLLVTAFIVILFSWTACKDKCGGDFGIQSIQPAANPVGYEIFIACKGVTANTKVRFDAVDAASVKAAEGGLIAKVPAGISGTVSLSIEEGECSDSKPFDVLGAYPGNVPPSPTFIVVPQNLSNVPSGISNEWVNIVDPLHKLNLQDGDPPFGTLDDFLLESYGYNPPGSGSYLNGNPISGTYSTVPNSIFMVIDRSAKAGGYKDTLTGSFIANLPSKPDASLTILLTSKRTGRQLVIYKEF